VRVTDTDVIIVGGPAEIAKAYLELDNQPDAEWQHELVY
jgi:hypothetical protein